VQARHFKPRYHTQMYIAQPNLHLIQGRKFLWHWVTQKLVRGEIKPLANKITQSTKIQLLLPLYKHAFIPRASLRKPRLRSTCPCHSGSWIWVTEQNQLSQIPASLLSVCKPFTGVNVAQLTARDFILYLYNSYSFGRVWPLLSSNEAPNRV